MSWGNPAHSNLSTNQLTEKKHSKRKAPYRPLERTEPLKRKAGWKTEAQSVKKEVLRRKWSPAKYQWEQKPLWLWTRSWVEDLRESHTKNQLEETGALQSAKKKKNAKKNWAEEAEETARKSSIKGRKVPLKRNNTTMKKNLVNFSKSQRKSHKRKNMWRKKQ